jgi:hypothetical protein
MSEKPTIRKVKQTTLGYMILSGEVTSHRGKWVRTKDNTVYGDKKGDIYVIEDTKVRKR